MASSNAWMVSFKILLMSIGAVSLGIAVKIFIPVVLQLSFSEVPAMWRCLSAWLKPPYLYFIINGIIISIVFSSRFFQNKEEQPEPGPAVKVVPVDYEMNVRPLGVQIVPEPKITAAYEMNLPTQLRPELEPPSPVACDVNIPAEMQPVVVYEQSAAEATVFEEKNVVTEEKTGNSEMAVDDGENSDDFVISRSSYMPPKRTDWSDIPSDFSVPAKPLVSATFGHRKPVKISHEGGRALRVPKPTKHDTLENTWKMITEGRAMQLNRHTKKSDPWDNHGCQINMSTSNGHDIKKLETFKDRTNEQLAPLATPSPTPLRKEPSLSQDELNQRAEAFIKKFNEEMRLQRQESLDQYKQMINRGS